MRQFILRFCSFILFGLSSQVALAACSFDDVIDKGIAFGKWTTDYQTEMGKLDPGSNRWGQMYEVFEQVTELMTPIGPLTADGQFDAACAQYAKLESLLDITISPEAMGTMTNKEMQAQIAEADSSSCDLVEASKLFVEVGENFAEKFAAGNMTSEQVTAFSTEFGPIQSMVSVDPAQACRDLVPFREKWGV